MLLKITKFPDYQSFRQCKVQWSVLSRSGFMSLAGVTVFCFWAGHFSPIAYLYPGVWLHPRKCNVRCNVRSYLCMDSLPIQDLKKNKKLLLPATLCYIGLMYKWSYKFALYSYFVPFIRFLVRVSYLEIYNENVRDLLGKDQNAKLEVCCLSYSLNIVTLQLFQKLLLVLIFHGIFSCGHKALFVFSLCWF